MRSYKSCWSYLNLSTDFTRSSSFLIKRLAIDSNTIEIKGTMVQIPFSGLTPPGKFSRKNMKEPINKIFNNILTHPNANCNFLFLNIKIAKKDNAAEKKKAKLSIVFPLEGSDIKSKLTVTNLFKLDAKSIEINPARNKYILCFL